MQRPQLTGPYLSTSWPQLVPYSCIYGYIAPDQVPTESAHQELNVLVNSSLQDRTVTIYYVEFTSPDLKIVSSPKTATTDFIFEQRIDVQRFMAVAKQRGVFPRPRRILLLVNPNGGVGRAKTIKESVVRPMLEHSGLMVKEQYTEYGRHAIDIAYKVNLEELDTLAVVSGDGVLHEIINGLLSRPDWNQSRRLPISIIPAGSGNAIATSLGTRSPVVATLALIRGETARLDIFSLSQRNRPRIYSMLLFSWGMMADADIESDRYRWLGPLRFDIAGFIRMIRLRRYPGKVYILPPQHESPGPIISSSHPPDLKGPAVQHESLLKHTQEEPPSPWKQLPNMPFYSMMLLLNCMFVGESIYFTDRVRFNDGIMHVWYSCETRFWRIVLPFVLDQNNGKLVERELMQYVKCGGLLIVPGVEGEPNDSTTHEIVHPELVTSDSAKQLNIHQKPGVFDVDGEVMPTARTLIEILPSFMDIVVPEWFHHKQDQGERADLARQKTEIVMKSARCHRDREAKASKIMEAAMLLLAMAAIVTTYAIFFSEGFQVWAGIVRHI
ncbi:ATP-NAD kinase-like domain-containing protein [Gamsiella multidivaricata]|uniref:ATP-NAD kinase-like domain-containing protein n=1 Tax=Gamsiella multidivaricata TaxID=101098 RepID=UPI002220E599|nr:ATP-NAD kinase-like domain-containing protein [Gamsiella multidivaricata]KAI7816525.1 ATP-NAD kinase-like domain-containing protein [Gamsiella multidivaricata]